MWNHLRHSLSFSRGSAAYIQFIVSKDAAKLWFHLDAIGDTPTVEFEADDSGNFNGSWVTKDNEYMTEAVQKDMGIELNLKDWT